MEQRVKWYDFQEAPAAELNALQAFAQDGLDKVVATLLFPSRRYTGFGSSKSSANAFTLDVAAGRTYFQGAVYPKAAATSHALTPYAPSSGTKIIIAVVGTDETETAVENRKFLTDVNTRTTQPKPVATRVARQAVVDFAVGLQGVSPVDPAVPPGYLGFARIVMGTDGIQSVTMMTENQVRRLDALEQMLDVHADILDRHESLLDTLRSDIAALARQLARVAYQQDLRQVWREIMQIRELLDRPDTLVLDGRDDFVTDSESDTVHASYDAEVHRGLHFKPAARVVDVLALDNPSDSRVKVDTSSGLMLPDYTLATRLAVAKRSGDLGFADYPSASRSVRLLKLSRAYIYYGVTGSHEMEEALLREIGSVKLFDPVAQAFATINLNSDDWHLEVVSRKSHLYRVSPAVPYWDVGLDAPVTYTGHALAQTYWESQGGWFKELDLWISDKATGAIHLIVCECTADGQPDLNRAVAATTLASSEVALGWSTFAFSPYYEERGKRYAAVAISTGAHRLGTAENGALANGTLFAGSDATVWAPDATRDLMIRKRAAKFKRARVVVELEDVNLSGGINKLQAVLTAYEARGTKVVLQGRIGAAWRDLDEADATVLSASPTQIPLRLALSGSADQAPGIVLGKSVTLSQRPKLTGTHISTARTTGSPVNLVRVQQYSRDFIEANHNWKCTLLTGAGYATESTEPTPVTKQMPDGSWQRSWVFGVTQLGAAISAYKIKTVLESNAQTTAFSVSRRRDAAYT